MKRKSKLAYFFIALTFFMTINFYFSSLITTKLMQGWNYSSALFKMIYIENTGAAFSIMQDHTAVLIIISIFAVLAILYYIFKNFEEISFKEIFFLSLLFSGILGNLYERLSLGYVRDFFELTFINFPIFNISDIFINIGVFGIIILILLTKKPIKLL